MTTCTCTCHFYKKNAATKGGGEGGELCPLTKQIKEGRFSEHNLFQIIGKKQNNITIKIKKIWGLFLEALPGGHSQKRTA